MSKSFKELLNKSREIDRNLGHHAERISRILWPWHPLWLLAVVGTLVILDFASTYALLELSGDKNFYESGRMAAWALRIGGFLYLFVIDVIAAVVLSLIALIARYLYNKHGFTGYGRAAFVFILTPYIVITLFAVANNIFLLQFR